MTSVLYVRNRIKIFIKKDYKKENKKYRKIMKMIIFVNFMFYKVSFLFNFERKLLHFCLQIVDNLIERQF